MDKTVLAFPRFNSQKLTCKYSYLISKLPVSLSISSGFKRRKKNNKSAVTLPLSAAFVLFQIVSAHEIRLFFFCLSVFLHVSVCLSSVLHGCLFLPFRRQVGLNCFRFLFDMQLKFARHKKRKTKNDFAENLLTWQFNWIIDCRRKNPT